MMLTEKEFKELDVVFRAILLSKFETWEDARAAADRCRPIKVNRQFGVAAATYFKLYPQRLHKHVLWVIWDELPTVNHMVMLEHDAYEVLDDLGLEFDYPKVTKRNGNRIEGELTTWRLPATRRQRGEVAYD